MAAGLGLLRLEPRAFWSMTLPELTAALGVLDGVRAGGAGIGRGDLAALMAQFPDRTASAATRDQSTRGVNHDDA